MPQAKSPFWPERAFAGFNDVTVGWIIFDRKMIFGAGAGHHFPIGGYLENEDLVFVLYVSRDYRPWLVERTRLFDAMNTWDGDKKRVACC